MSDKTYSPNWRIQEVYFIQIPADNNLILHILVFSLLFQAHFHIFVFYLWLYNLLISTISIIMSVYIYIILKYDTL